MTVERGFCAKRRSRVLDQLSVLFRALNRLPADADQRTAVLSIERTDPDQLRQAIDAYQQQDAVPAPDDSSNIGRGYTTGGLALVNFVFQDEAAEASDGDAQPTPAAPAPLRVGGLDVDVDVQTLPDLDVIILRGRDRDVRKLTEIIQELERLSRETQPRIRSLLAATRQLGRRRRGLGGRHGGPDGPTSGPRPRHVAGQAERHSC